ncbi:MAG: hypothetical protein K2Y23_15905 [Cyanobacteria bacterium]|nr:hypothetical protein [Cyanobacteriota bacterium]
MNNPIPTGRYYAVIAFTNGQMADARILFRGPSGEVPERPEFVSWKDQTVIYRTNAKGETLDLSRWTTYPTRDSIAPKCSAVGEAPGLEPGRFEVDIESAGQRAKAA